MPSSRRRRRSAWHNGRSGRPVEGGEESVSRGVGLAAARRASCPRTIAWWRWSGSAQRASPSSASVRRADDVVKRTSRARDRLGSRPTPRCREGRTRRGSRKASMSARAGMAADRHLDMVDPGMSSASSAAAFDGQPVVLRVLETSVGTAIAERTCSTSTSRLIRAYAYRQRAEPVAYMRARARSSSSVAFGDPSRTSAKAVVIGRAHGRRARRPTPAEHAPSPPGSGSVPRGHRRRQAPRHDRDTSLRRGG